MLARGRGVISVEDFRAMFNLPKDSEIIGFDVNNGEIEFFMISSEEVEGKFVITESFDNLRRFRLKSGDIIHLNDRVGENNGN